MGTVKILPVRSFACNVLYKYTLGHTTVERAGVMRRQAGGQSAAGHVANGSVMRFEAQPGAQVGGAEGDNASPRRHSGAGGQGSNTSGLAMTPTSAIT